MSSPSQFPIDIEEIKSEALKHGWDDAAATTAEVSEENIQAYRNWIERGLHAELHYMENDLRCYPQKLLSNAKTAILFASYYKQEKQSFNGSKDFGIIASYARGQDYHNIHRKRLKCFISWLEQRSGQIGCAKGFSDSVPIMEKALAVQAGLAWFGKNTLLIHRRFGTFFLLSGVLTTLEINGVKRELRLPKCGSCTRCLDACPTQALTNPYLLDASRCLSYHTIESKSDIPLEIAKKNPGYIFGCDICQDVCPHNVRKPLSLHEEFSPAAGNGAYIDNEKLDHLENHPQELFGTPLQRRKIKGLRKTFDSFLT